MTTAESSPGSLAARWFALLVADADAVVLESQRSARAKAIAAFVRAWKQGAFGAFSPGEQRDLVEEVGQKTRALAEADRSLDVQELLRAAVAELN